MIKSGPITLKFEGEHETKVNVEARESLRINIDVPSES